MTNDQIERLQRFVQYAQKLRGDEKGEAQVFCDRLFQAFGHAGYKEAGATLEDRQQRKGGNVKFIDLLWKPRLILEMKSRKEDLRDHPGRSRRDSSAGVRNARQRERVAVPSLPERRSFLGGGQGRFGAGAWASFNGGRLSQLVSRDRMEAPQTGVHKFGSKEKKAELEGGPSFAPFAKGGNP